MMMLGMQAVQEYLSANPTVTWQNIDQRRAPGRTRSGDRFDIELLISS
jgi:hypothetical protein